MKWAQKGLAGLLTLVLFVTLLGTALSTSANVAFGHPDKVEGWLNQSDFYGHFVTNVINQAKKSANSSNQASVTLSDTAVQQAAQSAFSKQLLQQSVKTFLDANYAWLQGKSSQPHFVIDLTQAKQSFGNQVGQYVQAHINSLPACTTQQLLTLGDANNVDPLNITCHPAQLSAQAEAQLVTQRIQSSSDFLSNPVISANNINPNGDSSSQPYYQKYASLPKLYRWGTRLPWIYAALAVLCLISIIFLAPRKRSGLRRVGITLALAGVVLIAIKFLADTVFNQTEKHVFNSANIGLLQQSLTNALHLAEHQLVRIDELFGLGYLLLALVVLVILLFTRNRKTEPQTVAKAKTNEQPPAAPPPPPATDLPRLKPTGPPRPPKRLIQ